MFEGYFYISETGLLVNLTDDTYISLPSSISSTCTSNYLITTNTTIWCLGENNNWSLQLIDYEEDKVSLQFNLPFSSNNYNNLFYYAADDIIVVKGQNSQEFKLVLFNTSSLQFICQKSQMFIPGVVATQYFGQNTIIWAQKSAAQYNYTSEIFTMGCNETVSVTTLLANNTNQIFRILGFNESTFFVAFYSVLVQSGTQNVLTPFTLNSDGSVQYGPTMNCVNISQVNDTYIVITDASNGFEQITIGVFDENLKFLPWSTWFSTLNGTAAMTYVTEGSLNVTVDLNIGSNFARFVFDFNIGGITYATGQYPPIQLGNGSWILMNGLGMFMLRADKVDYIYNFYPINAYFVKPSASGIVWGLFVPFGQWNYYGNCALFTININESTVNHTFFQSCPTTVLTKSVNLLDVAYNAEGVVTIGYRDNLGALFIVNSTTVLGPYTMTRPYITPALSLNLINSTATFIGSQWLSFTILTFNILTGSVLQKTNVPGDQQGYGTYNIDETYMLIGTSNNKAAVVEIWDVSTHTKVYQSQFDFYVQQFYVLEYQPNAPGLVLINANDVYVVNAQKQITQIPIPKSQWQQSFEVINSNSFWLLTNDYNFYYENVYNITSWFAAGERMEEI